MQTEDFNDEPFLQQRLNQFSHLTKKIAKEIQPILEKAFIGGATAQRKDSVSPIVTETDIKTEMIIRKIVEEFFPDDSILGEELPDRLGKTNFCWVIDPIDGTIAFRSGKPLFTSLLALTFKDKPVGGWIYQPILNRHWIGCLGSELQQNQYGQAYPVPSSLSECILSTTTRDMFQESPYLQFLDLLGKEVWMTTYGGDAFQYGLLVDGRIDVIVETQMSWHDYAALVPIVEASGGVISDFSGNQLRKNSSHEVLATRSEKLHQEILKIFQRVRSARTPLA
mgnify:CR=1 FL=1